MKILLAIDGTTCDNAAVSQLVHRDWPEGSEVRVLSVAHSKPYVYDPFFVGAATHAASREDDLERAASDVRRIARAIAARAPTLAVSTRVVEGAPREQIVAEARGWQADLIVIGAHDRRPAGRLLHRSVSKSVVHDAPCAVEVVHVAA
jgi:nucleotide-binding universal stress UspA family protein